MMPCPCGSGDQEPCKKRPILEGPVVQEEAIQLDKKLMNGADIFSASKADRRNLQIFTA